jgi:hypothetical protein
MSEFAKKFFDLVEGRVSEPPADSAQRQVNKDGADHNRQQQNLQSGRKEAARTSDAPREKGVSGFFGRVELTEENADGTITTHVKGCPAPAGEAPPAKLHAELPVDTERNKIRIGTTDYGADQVVAHDLGSMVKKTFDVASHATSDKRFRELETPVNPINVFVPHRGREDEFMDYTACKNANAAFMDLRKYSGEIDPHLIAATIRNEQYFYKNGLDTGPDHYVAAHGSWKYGSSETIGPAQIRVSTVNYLAEKFPEVLGPIETAVISAEDVHRAPFFVGAYFANVIHGIERNQKPEYISDTVWKQINEKWHHGQCNDALIIAYNPHPEQVKHIKMQLMIVREKHPD